MIQIILNLDTGAATLQNAAIIKVGAQVPVQIITQSGGVNTAPPALPSFQLALSEQSSSPTVRAYLETFTSENAYTFLGTLDGTDTRLVAFMSARGTVTLDCELSFTISDELQIAPNFPVSVQPRIVQGATSSEGGPTYYTTGQTDAKYAQIDPSTGAVMIGTSARLLPITNGYKIQVSADGGTTWQDADSKVAS